MRKRITLVSMSFFFRYSSMMNSSLGTSNFNYLMNTYFTYFFQLTLAFLLLITLPKKSFSQLVDDTPDLEETSFASRSSNIVYLTYEQGSLNNLGATSGYGFGILYGQKKLKGGLAYTWGRLSDIPEGTTYPDTKHKYRSFSANINYNPFLGKKLQPNVGAEYSLYSIGTKQEVQPEGKEWIRGYNSGAIGPTVGLNFYINDRASISLNLKYAVFISDNIAQFINTPDNFYVVGIRLRSAISKFN